MMRNEPPSERPNRREIPGGVPGGVSGRISGKVPDGGFDGGRRRNPAGSAAVSGLNAPHDLHEAKASAKTSGEPPAPCNGSGKADGAGAPQTGGGIQRQALNGGLNHSLISAGLVSRARGLSGEIFVRPFNEAFEWPTQAEKIFLNKRPFLSAKPFLPYKNGVRFFLRGIDTRDKAEALIGSRLSFLKSDFLKTAKEGEFYLFELAGFAVHVKGKGTPAGFVRNFSSHKGQDILLIERLSPSSCQKKRQNNSAKQGRSGPASGKDPAGSGAKHDSGPDPARDTGAQHESAPYEPIPVPFAEDYIEKICFQTKTLHLKLPENFPGIYTGLI